MEEERDGDGEPLGERGREENGEQRHADEIADRDGEREIRSIDAVEEPADQSGEHVPEGRADPEEDEQRRRLGVRKERKNRDGIGGEFLLVRENVVEIAAVHAPRNGPRQSLQKYYVGMLQESYGARWTPRGCFAAPRGNSSAMASSASLGGRGRRIPRGRGAG